MSRRANFWTACPSIFGSGLWAVVLSLPLSLTVATPAPAQQTDFPAVVNTQPLGESPPTAEQAARAITAPEGFQTTLFAGEPDVSQPIAMAMDDRGRLWVAECYTYADRGYDAKHRDRIVILEDVDGDGRHDRRKVFWDQGNRLTSLQLGFGGVWILNDGELQLLVDEDRDDRADGEPQTQLVGFTDQAGHNIVNGLLWGPDGWLYGRHGITASSMVGRPGDSPQQRVELNCSIWRFHPLRHTFEVVTHGTTNPWGMDFNDWGELFFTNNVIGHLWHVVPGAHYKRMFGEDFNPHLYQLIDQTADHYHWDHKANWTDSRDAAGKHGELGGGHSHCGGMIYLGDRWPAKYRNRIFMCNTHGRRVNQNVLERAGCGYVGRRAPDFMMANNPWFRGVDLLYGPDGDVLVSDWTDLGECHDHDGVHRTSGRVYKLSYGAPRPLPALLDRPLEDRTDLELVELQLHANDWFVRRARRLLQERAAAGRDLSDARDELLEMLDSHPDVTRRLRALWALHVAGGVDAARLRSLLSDEQESVRAWAVRLLTESPPSPESVTALAARAAGERSGLVRLHMAAALQRIEAGRRWPLARGLAAHSEDAEDPVQPLMLWYGIESAVVEHPDQVLALLGETKISLLRRHVARRLTSELQRRPQLVERLLTAAQGKPAAVQHDVLAGMTAALRGWRQAPRPQAWTAFREQAPDQPATAALASELAVVFGDGREMASLRKAIEDKQKETSERRNALQVLIDSKPADLPPLLHKLLGDRSLNDLAVAGLAQYDHPQTPQRILQRYKQLRPAAKTQAISTLAARKTYAAALLEAVVRGEVPRQDISASQARQMAALEDADVSKLLSRAWGSVRSTPDEKRKLLTRLKGELTDERLADADVLRGRKLFATHCGSCHRLFGEGKNIAPDLTGGNRQNMDYLLENLVDPSATVPQAYRTSLLRLEDGRVVSGVVVREEGPVLLVQTAKDELTLRRDEVRQRRLSESSLMPENLLELLKGEDLRDLLGYMRLAAARAGAAGKSGAGAKTDAKTNTGGP